MFCTDPQKLDKYLFGGRYILTKPHLNCTKKAFTYPISQALHKKNISADSFWQSGDVILRHS